jgi:hypothetical protein
VKHEIDSSTPADAFAPIDELRTGDRDHALWSMPFILVGCMRCASCSLKYCFKLDVTNQISSIAYFCEGF